MTMTGTVIKSNDAFNGAGGGLYVSGAGTILDVYKTYIQGNHALSYGGGVYTTSSGSTTLTNCLITGNRVEGVAYSDGGGVYNNAITNMYNSTVVGNYATRYGGGWLGGGTIQNSIFWVNSATTGPQIYNTTATVNYSDIEGGYGGAGTGNIGTNVVLHNPNFVGYSTATSGKSNPRGDFHIGSGSGPVDAGINNSSPPYDPPADDIYGGSRPLGGGVDMGAHEKE